MEPVVLVVLVAVVGIWMWQLFTPGGKGGRAVMRMMRSTPKEVIPSGARYFGCGFKTTRPGTFVASTGMARCFVSGHQICVDAKVFGILRFDRSDTTVRVGRGLVARYLELSNPEVAVRVFPSSWRSAQRLLSVHLWLPAEPDPEGA